MVTELKKFSLALIRMSAEDEADEIEELDLDNDELDRSGFEDIEDLAE